MYYFKCSKELFTNSWHRTLSNEPVQCYMCICIITKLTASFIFTSSGLSLQMKTLSKISYVASLALLPYPAVRHLQYGTFAHVILGYVILGCNESVQENLADYYWQIFCLVSMRESFWSLVK